MSSSEHVVAGETDDWQPVNELLDGERENVGVVSLSPGTEIKNGSIDRFGGKVFHIGEVDEVRGKYMLLHPEIVGELPANMERPTLGPGDRNDANFYIGRSSGVPWFEFKWDDDFDRDWEPPHAHNAWEIYTFVGGEGVLGLAGESYDFAATEPDSWDYRNDVVYAEVEEGEVFGVPPGVPHRVEEHSGDPDLVITRYGDEEVAKYDLEGEPVYPENQSERLGLRTYPEALE